MKTFGRWRRRRLDLRVVTALTLGTVALCARIDGAERPNILWVTSEDNGPHLGAYGDEYADTPSLDALARRGMSYRYAWSTAPVCAPARTTIISGLYPPSTGAEHMRSMVRLPEGFRMFPVYLREAGYYCTNNSKEDYNLEKTGQVWDESSRKAHWRGRAEGQPFFAVFNFTTTHESQIRKRPHQAVHDPATVRVPRYHPDRPEVRQDWAQYHDKMTEMDAQVGRVLAELEADGLAEDTLVFYYGDHGPGMPRSKRCPYDSGLRVPMIVHVPEKWSRLAPDEYAVGGASDRLVGFIDLAPTVLSAVGIRPPAWMQGHAFLGEFESAAPRYQFGFRGRMDERYDLIRVVRDERWIYIRNFMPHRPWGQFVDYMFQTPTTRVWKQLHDEGALDADQAYFWEPKASEELYDLRADPDETRNLASSAEHRETLERLRQARREWTLAIRDVGFLPEAEVHSRAEGSTPYEMGHDGTAYPLGRIHAMAEYASDRAHVDLEPLVAGLSDPDSAVRYWAITGLRVRGAAAYEVAGEAARRALEDRSPSVRAVAGEVVGLYGSDTDVRRAVETLVTLARLDESGLYESMLALNALDAVGSRAAFALEKIRALPKQAPGVHPRLRNYVNRLIERIVAELEGS